MQKQTGRFISFMTCRPTAAAIIVYISCAALSSLFAQAPGVEIVRDKGEQHKMLVDKANKLMEEGKLMSLKDVRRQLDRKSCEIELPAPNKEILTDREIWKFSKDAHLRVGWHYRCKKCDNWHQNLAGGYFINKDGAVATCFHVIDKTESSYREGYLIAANDQGDLFPVTEILAGNEVTDTAIIRVKAAGGDVTALPLNANTYPGDAVWCYSDPLGRSGYFSKGMINRFYVYKKNGKESSRMAVSTDWAPGSSGAAVLDAYGNAVGHVSEISAAGSRKKKVIVKSKNDDGENEGKDLSEKAEKILKNISHNSDSVIVFHCAARAADVLALVEGNDL